MELHGSSSERNKNPAEAERQGEETHGRNPIPEAERGLTQRLNFDGAAKPVELFNGLAADADGIRVWSLTNPQRIGAGSVVLPVFVFQNFVDVGMRESRQPCGFADAHNVVSVITAELPAISTVGGGPVFRAFRHSFPFKNSRLTRALNRSTPRLSIKRFDVNLVKITRYVLKQVSNPHQTGFKPTSNRFQNLQNLFGETEDAAQDAVET
jgi:hypothetical protein